MSFPKRPVTLPRVSPPAPKSASGPKRLDSAVTPPRARSIVVFVVVTLLSVGLGVVWSIIADRQLAASMATESREHLESAHKAFAAARARVQASLQSHCRVMVEDPRLKATLATEGMDEATVSDILQDLSKLRGAGFLMVLSSDGRVFAQAGAPELRGLDLSDSSIVKKAQYADEAAAGAWVLGKRVMDLSIKSIRYDEVILAYLVVGEAVDEAMLRSVADQTGVHVANALASAIVGVSSLDARSVLSSIAQNTEPFGRVVDIESQRYVTGVVELAETAQSHRLLLARPFATAASAFKPVRWMLLVPPLLVFITALFALSVMRTSRRNS